MSILCYHSVEADWHSPMAMEPELFARHCEWLARNRTVVPLAEAVARMDRHGRLPRNVVALTFDDGFSALHDQVMPVLAKHRLPATVFLVAETLTDAGRPVDWVDTPPDHALTTLTTEQVLEMREAGIDFQSHSFSHLDLTTLSQAECVRDLRESRDVLEDLLRAPVTELAYPRGRHSAVVRGAAEKVGYAHSYGLPEQHEPMSAHSVPRVGVHRGNDTRVLRVKDARNYLRVRHSTAYGVLRRAVRR